jgi:hypothetical protein
MVEAMKRVVPDVRVAVEFVATTVWSKEAKNDVDDQGRLIAWSLPAGVSAGVPHAIATPERRKTATKKKRLDLA